MRLIDATNAEEYLRETERVSPSEHMTVRELSGGVSNIVLRVEFPNSDRASFVLKQAREQLRVAQPWFCSPERIWREVEILRACTPLLGAQATEDGLQVSTPVILWEDRDRFIFAMNAASGTETWKQVLLEGDSSQNERQRPTRAFTKQNEAIARACGQLLGRLHGASWERAALAGQFGDRRFFDDLRVEPYYQRIAEVHPAIASSIASLIAEMEHHRQALVHGDFSPKNLLIGPDEVTLIDCEVGHWGDPAFDLGFFLTHLQLKAIHCPERAAYFEALSVAFYFAYCKSMERCGVHAIPDYWQRVFRHLRACLLARVDGKSPAEYLDERERETARTVALDWFRGTPYKMLAAFANVRFAAEELAAQRKMRL